MGRRQAERLRFRNRTVSGIRELLHRLQDDYPASLPLIRDLDQPCTDQADDGGIVGKDAQHIGAAPDLPVKAPRGIGEVDARRTLRLRSLRPRKLPSAQVAALAAFASGGAPGYSGSSSPPEVCAPAARSRPPWSTRCDGGARCGRSSAQGCARNGRPRSAPRLPAQQPAGQKAVSPG